jgi:heme/copper-type cytochrome/quinol oxidase subunit 3
MMDHVSFGSVLAIFLLLFFFIALVLVLTCVTQKSCELEQDRANVIRAQLWTFLTIALGVLVLVCYRHEMQHAVKHFMH